MNKTELFKRIEETGVIAVIRKVPNHKLHDLIEALVLGGINIFEVTVDVPDAFTIIKNLASTLEGRALVGAGTVLDSSSAHLAIHNGAEFIVSPNLNIEVVKTTRRYGKLSIPGIMTPTEAVHAIENGADIVKVFPASSVGAEFIKNLKGPLPQIPIIPTGGVDLANASDFIKAGAIAVGVGGSLIDKKLMDQGNFKEIEINAKLFVESVKNARSS